MEEFFDFRLLAQRADLLQIVAGAECFASGREHNDARAIVVRD